MTDMYLKMGAGDLIRHYAYLTQAMVHHAISVDKVRWSYQQAAEDLKNQKAKTKDFRGVPAVEQKPRKARGQLNAAKALKIYKSRLPTAELARRYSVHRVTISDIKSGRSWNAVTGHPKEAK